MEKMVDFYRGKKVLITGHTGFKGTWLTEILLKFGAEVAGYSHQTYEMFDILKTKNKITHFEGDIRDFTFLKSCIEKFQPDIVLHLAAQPLVRDSYDEPVYTYDVNVMGTVNILEVVRSLDCIKSFINVTTDKVYLNREWNWGYRENEELCGYDPYSNSKSCSELVSYSYKKSFFDLKDNISVSTARSGNVIGGGDFSANRIIPDCIKYAANKEEIIIRNPNSTRPYQHVMDCISGYLLLAIKQYNNKSFEGCYNFGPNEEDCITTGTLVEKFCNEWKENASFKIINNNGPHEAGFLKLDCSKSKNILNWQPLFNVDEAIALCVEWAKCSDKNDVTNRQIQYFIDKL
ncbi:MAG: CDP-glucose 4,6-dehydratase [Bacilli bacterium]